MTMISIRAGAQPLRMKAPLTAIARWIERCSDNRRKRRETSALARMPDRLLRDIGLERIGERQAPLIRFGSW